MHCDKMGYVLTLCHFPLLAWHFLLACHFHVCEKGSRGRGERGERGERDIRQTETADRERKITMFSTMPHT